SHLILCLKVESDDLFKAEILKFIGIFLKTSATLSNIQEFQKEFRILGLSNIIKDLHFQKDKLDKSLQKQINEFAQSESIYDEFRQTVNELYDKQVWIYSPSSSSSIPY